MRNDSQEEGEKTTLDIVKERLRHGLYGGFYVLLSQSEQGAVWKFTLLYLILLLQMLSYSFNDSVSKSIVSDDHHHIQQLGDIWKAPSVINIISPILSTFRIVYWLEKVNWNIYIIIVYVCVFLIFFIAVNFIYVAYCYSQRKFPFAWPIPLLRYTCNIIVTILFIPILGKHACLNLISIELFMKISSCGYLVDDPVYNDGTLRNTVFNDVQCFRGIHILHAVLSYVMIGVFLIMSYIITSCFYESRIG